MIVLAADACMLQELYFPCDNSSVDSNFTTANPPSIDSESFHFPSVTHRSISLLQATSSYHISPLGTGNDFRIQQFYLTEREGRMTGDFEWSQIQSLQKETQVKKCFSHQILPCTFKSFIIFDPIRSRRCEIQNENIAFVVTISVSKAIMTVAASHIYSRLDPRNPTYNVVQLSSVQNPLEEAQFDVLLLPESCFSGTAEAEGFVSGTTEVEAACGFNNMANVVELSSFADALMTELRRLSP